MMSGQQDSSSMVSHRPARAAFLKWDVTKGREGCWEGIASLTKMWEDGAGAW